MTQPEPSTFRLAGPADSRGIAALHAASWRAHYRESLKQSYLDGPIDDERAAVWAIRLSRPDPRQLVLLAEAGGEVLGFACAFTDDDPVWGTLIDNLHVRVDRKRGGMGRMLVGHLAQHLESRVPGQPVHLFVLAANVAAQGFYDRIGGRQVERDNHVTPDGSSNPVIRYAWDSPAALTEATIGR